MATVDSLDIQISAQVNKANASLTTLIRRLDRVSSSLSGVNTRGLATMGAGVNKLANAMSNFSTNTRTADFSRLARNLNSISAIDTSKFSEIASKMSQLSTAFNGFSTMPEGTQQIGEFAKNISKLGNKSVQSAIDNVPRLATAIKNLIQTLSTAPRVRQDVIDMTKALAALASQGGKVGTASNTLSQNLNRYSASANRANKSSKSLASTFGTLYANFFWTVRGAKKLMGSIRETTEYIEAFNYYNVAFGKIASEWDKDFEKYGYSNAESYAESFTKRMNETLGKLSGVQVNLDTGLLEETGMQNLGLNIQEITQYASQLASVTNSVGQTGEVSLAAAKSMTMLAGDISSLFNIDYSSVAQNIQSGLIGQSRALYKYGIDITNATLQTYAYELGLEKTVTEMTQAEKMQLRMIAILDQSKVSWGDLANTINSPSNMLRQFSNNLKELSMVFGQLFIPVLQKVMPIINGVVIAIKRLVVSIAELLGVKIDFESFGQGYSDLSDGADDLSDSLGGVAASAKKAKAGLRAFDELKVINMPETSGGVGGGVGAGIDLTDQILKATEEYEKAWNEAFSNMENKAQDWANKIEKALEPVKKIFQDFAVGDFFQAGKDTSALVSGIFDFFTEALKKVNWNKIGKNVGKFFAGIDWKRILKSVGKLIWTAIKSALDFWAGAFDAAPIETGIITAISVLKFTKLGGLLKDKINGALGKISENLNLSSLLGAVAAYAGEFVLIEDGFSRLVSGSGNLYTALTEIAAGAGVAIGALKMLGLLNPFTGILVAATGLVGAFFGVIEAQKEYKEELKNTTEIDLFGDTLENIGEKLNDAAEATRNWKLETDDYLRGVGVEEAAFAQGLADRYFDLAEKQSLTNDERLEMIGLAEKLVETFPSLQQYYDEETGLIDTTREAVDALIESKLREIQLSAIEDKLKEAYSLRYDRLEELNDASERYAIALEELNGLQEKTHDLEKLRDAVKAYEDLQHQVFIGARNEEDLQKATEELYDLLGKYGLTEIPTLSEVNRQLDNSKDKVWQFSETYSAALDHLNEAQSTYDEVEESITSLSDAYTNTVIEQQKALQETEGAFQDTEEEIENVNDRINKKLQSINEEAKRGTDELSQSINRSKEEISDSYRHISHSAEDSERSVITSYDNIISKTKDFVKELKEKLKNTPILESSNLIGGVGLVQMKVKGYAVGGFPEDGWFRASQGEIMGRFDNGKSVVANNMQITEGISYAVQAGNQENNMLMRQEINILQRQNEILVGILQKEFGISKNDIGRAAQDYSEEYMKRTGRPAYGF